MVKTLDKKHRTSNLNAVKDWLTRNQRNKVFLARCAGLPPATMTNLFQGKQLSPTTIVKIAQTIQKPLYAFCVLCNRIHRTNLNGGGCNSKG